MASTGTKSFFIGIHLRTSRFAVHPFPWSRNYSVINGSNVQSDSVTNTTVNSGTSAIEATSPAFSWRSVDIVLSSPAYGLSLESEWRT